MTINILTFISTIASAALTFLTLYLASKRNVHIFIVVGQSVFKSLAVVLAWITISRLFVYAHLFTGNTQRFIAGIVYILAIVFILVMVGNHARRQ